MENMNPETSKKNTFSGFFLKIPSRHFRQNKFSLQEKKNYIGAFLERKFSLSRESLEGRRGNVGQMFVLFINVHDLNTKVAFFRGNVTDVPLLPGMSQFILFIDLISTTNNICHFCSIWQPNYFFTNPGNCHETPAPKISLPHSSVHTITGNKVRFSKILGVLSFFCVLQYVCTSKVPLLPIHSVPENFKTLKTPIYETVTP